MAVQLTFNGISSNGSSVVDWSVITNKPTTFTPSTHNHNSIYYTKQEVDEMTFGSGGGGLTLTQTKKIVSDYVGVINASTFGVKGDCKSYVNGSINSGSANFSTTEFSFSAGDEGKLIVIYGAGTGGARLIATILSVQGQNNVTLNTTASTTVSGAKFFFGTDNQPMIDEAITEATYIFSEYGNAEIVMPEGSFLVGDSVNIQNASNLISIVFRGVGSRYPYDIENRRQKGTVLRCTFGNKPLVRIQGVVNLKFKDITLKGTNLYQVGYGPAQIIEANYLSNGEINTRYNAGCGIHIDPNPGAPPSSIVLIDNCKIINFPVGIMVHGNGSPGQGEFVMVRDTNVQYCHTGMSVSNNQARLTTIVNSRIDNVFTCFTNNTHGDQLGRINLIENCHFSGYQLFNLGNMSWNGPLPVRNSYAETLFKIGAVGQASTSASYVTFYDCDLNLSGQEASNTIPVNILQGHTVKFVGGRVIGLNLDMDLIEPPVLDGVHMIYSITYQYDRTFHFGNNTAVYKRMFQYHPFSTGIQQKVIATKGTKIIMPSAGGGDTWDYDRTCIGTNAYESPINYENYMWGNTSIKDDYMWASKALNNVVFENKSLSGMTLTFTYNNTLNALAQAALSIGDIIYIREKGVKFMVTNRVGNAVTCMLLNGFKYDPVDDGTPYSFVSYEFDAANLWTYGNLNTPVTVYWYNTNFYDHRPIVATASNSGVLSAVSYPFLADNFALAEEQVKVGSIVNVYSVANGALDVPQSAIQRAIVTGINTSTHVITVNTTISLTGQVLVYNKWPFEKK